MNIFDFTVKTPDGGQVKLEDYRGKVILIVNTATGCRIFMSCTRRMVWKSWTSPATSS